MHRLYQQKPHRANANKVATLRTNKLTLCTCETSELYITNLGYPLRETEVCNIKSVCRLLCRICVFYAMYCILLHVLFYAVNAIADLGNVEICFETGLVGIFFAYLLNKSRNGLFADQRYGATAEAATRHTAADYAIYFPCGFCGASIPDR